MKKLSIAIALCITLALSQVTAVPLFEAATLRQLNTWLDNCQNTTETTSPFLSVEQQIELVSIDFQSVAKLIPMIHAHKKINPQETSNLNNHEIALLYTKLVKFIFGREYATYLQIYQQSKDMILNIDNNQRASINLNFIEKYLNFSCDNETGKTILHEAVINQSPCLPILLTYSNIDINAQDGSGFTPLHHAILNLEDQIYEQEDNDEAAYENILTLFMLLQAGCNPNIQDFYGSTPLHYAAIAGLPRAAQLLLSYKADPTIKNFKGKSSTDYAKEAWDDIDDADQAQERIKEVYNLLCC